MIRALPTTAVISVFQIMLKGSLAFVQRATALSQMDALVEVCTYYIAVPLICYIATFFAFTELEEPELPPSEGAVFLRVIYFVHYALLLTQVPA